MNYHLWYKVDNFRYIRQAISLNKNLKSKSCGDNKNYIFNTLNEEARNSLVSKIKFDKDKDYFKKLSFDINNSNDYDNDDDDDYINNFFKKYFKDLMINIYAIDALQVNAIVLLGEIFNICNVIAFDIREKYILVLYDNIIYIILYEKHSYFEIDTKLYDIINKYKHQPKTCNEGQDCLQCTSKDEKYLNYFKYYEIQNYVKNFMQFNTNCKTFDNYDLEMKNKNQVIEMKNKNQLNNLLSNLFANIIRMFFKTPQQVLSNRKTINEDEDCSLSSLSSIDLQQFDTINWQSFWLLPKDYFSWTYHNDKKVYIRSNINFQYNLNCIYTYNINDKHYFDKNKIKIHSLSLLEYFLFYKNYLYVENISLIYHNVIYIDFKNLYFITLNIKKIKDNNVCEFKAISFIPNFSFNGMSNNDIMIPFTNFELSVNYDTLTSRDLYFILSRN